MLLQQLQQLQIWHRMALNFLLIIVSVAETGSGKSKYVHLLDAKYLMTKGVASNAGALVGQWS